MLLSDAIYPAEAAIPGSRLQHVLMTRFAMRVEGPEPPSVQWLERRIPIFADVCLPSITHQTSRPYLWLIGVDQRILRHLDALKELISPYPWIRMVCQQRGEPALVSFARAMVNVKLEGSLSYFLTTRLDSDDALALNYVRDADLYASAVLGCQVGLEDFWISFPLGAQLVENVFSLYVSPKNHFLTRVINTDLLSPHSGTAFDVKHRYVFDENRTVFTPFTEFPMWLQNVHGDNIANKPHERRLEFQPHSRVAALFSPTIGR